MPIKYNLTRYDTLASKIKKVSLKKSPSEMTKDDFHTMLQAVLIAAFTSGHSWQTYKFISSQDGASKSQEIRKEFTDAFTSKWRTVSPFDIGEFATTSIPDTTFSEWLTYTVGREHHDGFRKAWGSLCMELSQACDEVERSEA